MNMIERARKLLESNVSSIAFSQLRDIDVCPSKFLAKSQETEETQTADEVVGQITHAISEHGKDSRVVKMLIKNELSRLPQEAQQIASAEIERVAANAAEMEKNDTTKVTRKTKRGEVTYRWRFEAAACDLCARPDRVRFIEVDGEEVLEIRDGKKGYFDPTTRRFPPKKDTEQGYFFGLVVSQALGWTGKVRLVLEYWGSKNEHEYWFSRGRVSQQLAEIKTKIERIRRYIAENSFPEKAGFWCEKCPLFAECVTGQRYTDIKAGRYHPLPVSVSAAAS